MSDDRALHIAESEPPRPVAPWDDHAEPLDPNVPPPPPPSPAGWMSPDQFAPPGPAGWMPPPGEPPPVQTQRRWRFVPRSLSSRLVVFVVALVMVVVAAAGTATYVALHSFLLDRVDQQLVDTATSDSLQYLLNGHQDSSGLRNPQTVWVEVIDLSGKAMPNQPGGLSVATFDLQTSTRKALAGGTKSPTSVTTTTGTHLRVMSVGGSATSTDPATGLPIRIPVRVIVGLSTSELDRTLHRLVLLEVAIGALAVAAALVLTSWGVHLSLRPLNRVTRTAREVTAELSPEGAGLDRRVPEGDPETEVGQLADSFNSLMGTVETQFAERLENEQRMRQFLADASHELRTPLTSIRGYAELSRMRRASGASTSRRPPSCS